MRGASATSTGNSFLIVVVTGGFGALAQSVGRAFVESGAPTVVLGHQAPRPELLIDFPAPVRLLGGVDLTQWDTAHTAMAEIAREYGADPKGLASKNVPPQSQPSLHQLEHPVVFLMRTAAHTIEVRFFFPHFATPHNGLPGTGQRSCDF